MATEKVFGKHPITGVVAQVSRFELQVFGMQELKGNERTGKPVINVAKPTPLDVPTEPIRSDERTPDAPKGTSDNKEDK